MSRERFNDGLVGIAVVSRRQIFAATATASAGGMPFSPRKISAIIRSALPASIRSSVIFSPLSEEATCFLTKHDLAKYNRLLANQRNRDVRTRCY